MRETLPQGSSTQARIQRDTQSKLYQAQQVRQNRSHQDMQQLLLPQW
jgi:hypothetical protein